MRTEIYPEEITFQIDVEKASKNELVEYLNLLDAEVRAISTQLKTSFDRFQTSGIKDQRWLARAKDARRYKILERDLMLNVINERFNLDKRTRHAGFFEVFFRIAKDSLEPDYFSRIQIQAAEQLGLERKNTTVNRNDTTNYTSSDRKIRQVDEHFGQERQRNVF
jgi:hypothetical protein